MSGNSGILRRFKDGGITEFVRRIETLRAGGQAEIDDALVNDPSLTEPIVPEVPMERPAFKTKRDAGAYLSERTRAARAVLGDDDRGLWTWLSAWHWDAVCPVRENGLRKVLAAYHYSYGQGNPRDKLRHLLATAVVLYQRAPECRFLGESPVTGVSKSVDIVVSRLNLMRLPAIPELLDRLYWDATSGRPKTGIMDSRFARAGDLRYRLPARIRQLEVTHDLTNLTAEQLLSLLGDEFRQWAVTGAEPGKTTAQQRRSGLNAS